MLRWALIFFVISLVAGLFGFTGISAGAATVAKIIFFMALTFFVVFLAVGVIAGRKIASKL